MRTWETPIRFVFAYPISQYSLSCGKRLPLDGIQEILKKLDGIESKVNEMQKDVHEIKADISKIKKFVATDNSDFKVYLNEGKEKLQ